MSKVEQEIIDSTAVAQRVLRTLSSLDSLYDAAAVEQEESGSISTETRSAAEALMATYHQDTRYLDIRGFLMHANMDIEFPDLTEGGGGGKTIP